jgi:NADH-quinone oxidoreductase subunit M
VGSIFLAAILLKLGGFGLILFQDILLLGLINTGLIALSIIGALYVALLCCQVIDLKVLIAFSSVGHMGLAVIVLLLGGQIGALRCVSILVRHGFSSSARFYAAYIFYKTTSSRRILINKNLFSLSGAAAFF